MWHCDKKKSTEIWLKLNYFTLLETTFNAVKNEKPFNHKTFPEALCFVSWVNVCTGRINCIWLISCVCYLAEGSWLLLPGPAAHGTCLSASQWTLSSLSADCVALSETPVQPGLSPNSAPAHHACDSSHWLVQLTFSSYHTQENTIVYLHVQIYRNTVWTLEWNGMRLNRLETTSIIQFYLN